MLRVSATRASANFARSRKYATAPPPGATPPPPPSGGGANWPLILVGLAAVGGAGYYFTMTDKPHGDEVKAKAKELEAATKAKAESYKQDGKDKYLDAKAGAQNILQSAENRTQQAYGNLKTSANETATDAQKKYESLRSSLSSEAKQAQHDVEKKKEEAKAGWFSWLGWGKGKAEEGKETAAGKIADGADEVKKAAERRA